MDKDRNEIRTARIFKMLDLIENKLNVMAHEISRLSDKLKQWQDGNLNSIFFLEYLNQYFDGINN